MMVDLTGRFQWITNYSNKQWKKLFWKIRASLKKAFKSNGRRFRLLCIRPRGGGDMKFQYDPSSYALNFDDGLWSSSKSEIHDHQVDKQEEQPDTVNNDGNFNGFRVVKIVRRQQVSPVVVVHDTDQEVTNDGSDNNSVTWIYVFLVKIM